MSISRRAAFAAPLAVAALAAPAQAQSPILGLLRECGQRMRAVDALAEIPGRLREAERAARCTAFQAAVARMVDAPAASLKDAVAKLAVALSSGVDEAGVLSLSDAEERLFHSAFDDLRRLCPELEAALFEGV